MYKYVARRLILSIPVLVLSSLIVFGLMRVMPGDALTALMGESGNVGPRQSCLRVYSQEFQVIGTENSQVIR